MTWVAAACTIALLALGAGSARAQFQIDHYLVYDLIDSPSVFIPAELQDQFGFGVVDLGQREKLANPVAKAHEPDQPNPEDILYPNEHLSWWKFAVAEPNPARQIQVTNQFGSGDEWTLYEAEYLLVPAVKNQQGDISLNQHYKCYRALGPAPGDLVNLQDQFGQRFATVGNPRYFCNPVEKLGPSPPLQPSGPPPLPDDHLACYEIEVMPYGDYVMIDDQIHGAQASETVDASVLLCAPSQKIYDQTPSLTPWGIAALGLLMLLTVFGIAHRRLRYAEPA